eukprot:5960980-Alexandrium_andersonii.AAC.1
MSASLVGSEMCIRDRCVGGRPAGLTAPCQPISQMSTSAGASKVGAQMSNCLLYTSDAADDM